MLQHSHNPFDAYRGKTVPAPSMGNSPRLNSLIRDGKLYLSLRDAIDLALENNLDIVIARYNLPIAQMDILRTKAGGVVRGVHHRRGIRHTGWRWRLALAAGSGAGGTSSGAGGAGAGAGGLVQSTFGVGTTVSSYDPFIQAKVYNDHTSQLLTNRSVYGVPVYKLNENLADISYIQSFPTGTYFEADWFNNRQTSNSPYNTLNPALELERDSDLPANSCSLVSEPAPTCAICELPGPIRRLETSHSKRRSSRPSRRSATSIGIS